MARSPAGALCGLLFPARGICPVRPFPSLLELRGGMSSLEHLAQTAAWPSALQAKWQRLLREIGSWSGCVVAFSGGVDSATVAAVAHALLGSQAVAVTGRSASVSDYQARLAAEVARKIGIRHLWLETREMESASYRANAPDRCYHCKHELYTQLLSLARKLNLPVVANGANADDAGDYRPGMLAAGEFQVRSPLLECEITKQEVRQLARALQLPVWNEPASPCLSSRVAYGLEVTPERLQRIERAEAFLRSRGFWPARVRLHPGELARVEVPREQLCRLLEPTLREELAQELRRLGFRFLTLDLEGLRSGNLNQLVPLLSLPSSQADSD